MKWLMKLLGVDPELMRLAKSGMLKTEDSMTAFKMSDEEKLDTLRKCCHAYGTKDFSDFNVVTMDGVVRSIGEILNERGGVEEMRRMFDQVDSSVGIYYLEIMWDGIGEWMATLPASDLAAQSDNEKVGNSLRTTISVDGRPVEAEFFDGVICTGEEQDDLTGNFDLSMRVNQPIPFGAVLQQLTVKMPWGNKQATLDTNGSASLPDGLLVSLVVDEAAPWLEDRSQVPEWADVYWGDSLLGRVTIRTEQ